MNKEAIGTVISVKKQWWLKINTKPFRKHVLDGAIFPHIIKVKYAVNGNIYTKRKWINAGSFVPNIGDFVLVNYLENKPSKSKISYLTVE